MDHSHFHHNPSLCDGFREKSSFYKTGTECLHHITIMSAVTYICIHLRIARFYFFIQRFFSNFLVEAAILRPSNSKLALFPSA